MMGQRRARGRVRSADGPPRAEETMLRVIGGRLRGRKFIYTGDVRTRPMKQRVREAVFNLLGPAVVGTHVVDLFAGSGALAWEALSRGATGATLIERHFPTARVIRRNAELLGVESCIELRTGDAFFWGRQLVENAELPAEPWVVFCSPPYDLYVSQTDALLDLIGHLVDRMPPASQLVVESDPRFDCQRLPVAERWDVRAYPPAVVAIRTKETSGD